MRVAAAFDALAVTAALERSAHGAAAAEVHMFAYLSCLIGIYNGDAPEQWRYDFMATPAGAPYAHVLEREVDSLRASGRLLDSGDLLVLSQVGSEELEELRSFPSLLARAPYVDAACATASLQPLPSIADALAQEPQLQEALGLHSSRELLTDSGLLLLDRQFRALRSALAERGSTSDLLVPAAVWMGYLAALARAAVQDEIARQGWEEPV
jgi:hypothetical protein